jgi:PEP-CTERM motif
MRGLRGKAIQIGLMAVLLMAGMLVAAPPLHAISFNLTSDHCDPACGTPGTIFGFVDVMQNGPNVDITVHLNTGYAYAKTGAVDMQAFKFNGVGVALGDVTINAHVPSLAAAAGAFNGNGTGNFGFGINCPTCGGGLSDGFSTDIVFHVANATIAEVTAPNNLGNIFVADVGVTASGQFNGRTGPIDATGPTTTVPEPLTVTLLGLGLFGIGAALRRKKNR